MKLYAIPVFAALTLAGCGTVNIPSPDSTATVITQVKGALKTTCGFVATAQTLSNLLAAFGVPYIGMAQDIANQVCSEVAKVSAVRGHVPMVRGVKIRGHRA